MDHRPSTSIRTATGRWLATAGHGWVLVRCWTRLQRILADFVRQCGDLPRPRLLVWTLLPDWHCLGLLLRPRKAGLPWLSPEQRMLARLHRRLERFCRGHVPRCHPLTAEPARRLQGAVGQQLLESWFAIAGLTAEQLAVLGSYGSLAELLRDLLAYAGAPFRLATREGLQQRLPNFVHWAALQLTRPDVCRPAPLTPAEFRRAARRSFAAWQDSEVRLERRVQQWARNRIALAMYWQAHAILVARVVTRLQHGSPNQEQIEAAWQTAAQRLEHCLLKTLSQSQEEPSCPLKN